MRLHATWTFVCKRRGASSPTLRFGITPIRLAWLICTALMVFAQDGLAEAEPVYVNFRDDPRHNMVVSYHYADDQTPPAVHYRERGSTDPWMQQDPVGRDFQNESKTIYHADLSDLEALTEYEFKVGEEGEVFWFLTMPDDLSRPVVGAFGADFQEGPDMWVQMTELVVQQDVDFFVVAGDWVNDDGNLQRSGRWVNFWNRIWRKLVNDEGRMIPFVAGVGNHECKHNVNMERFFFTDMFAFPDEGEHEFYGVIDFGDYLSLVALDSEMESRADQDQWLQGVLAERSEVQHIVPYYHRPIFPSHRQDYRDRVDWFHTFYEAGIRKAFCGHDHAYKRTHEIVPDPEHDGGVRLAVEGESGFVEFGDGGLGTKYYDANLQDEWYMADVRTHINHFSVVRFEPDGMRVITYDGDGEAIYWEGEKYAVTLNHQEGDGGSESVEVVYGMPMPTADAPTREGYLFAGYFTEANGEGTQYYNPDMSSARDWDIEEDTTLYAAWRLGVEVGVASVDSILGITQNDTEGYYVDSGSDQVGVGGGAPNRTCNTPIIGFDLPTLTEGLEVESVTLHYQISAYRMHDGEAFDARVYLLDSDDPSETGTTFYYQGPEDTRPIVSFVGSQSLSYPGTTDQVDIDPVLTVSHTLSSDALELFKSFYDGTEPTQSKAFFRLNRSTVSLDGLGGSALNRFNIGTQPDELRIAIATTGEPVFKFSVTYDANDATDGTAPVDSNVYDPDATVTVLGNTGDLVRTGYEFDGWNTQADGNGTSYAENDTFDISASTTLYAAWAGNTYTVTFDKQGGTGGTGSIDATFGSDMPSAAAPTRAGYLFSGYFTEVNGNGTQYYSADMSSTRNWDIDDETTLYAHWTLDLDVGVSILDAIRGEAQVAGDVGYLEGVSTAVVGPSGSTGERRDDVIIAGFTLPTLPEGRIIESVSIHYAIREYRHADGDDFDVHVYLLDTVNPRGTDTTFYYQGPEDPNPDVMFVGETVLPYEEGETGYQNPEPPIPGGNELTGDALEWFRALYTGSQPSQSEVFFRFNTTLWPPSVTDSYSFNRYEFEEAPEKLFIEITTVSDHSDEYQSWLQEHYGDPDYDDSQMAASGVHTIRQAYIAGLIPTNASARFVMDNAEMDAAARVLHWTGVEGRRYHVYWRSNLLNGAEFEPIASNIHWSVGAYTDTVERASSESFYRIGVELVE